jgi:hypothetical protein
MTARQLHEDKALGIAFLAALINPAPAEFIEREYSGTFGNRLGRFEDNWGDLEADEELDERGIQEDLTVKLSHWERYRADDTCRADGAVLDREL